MFTIDLRTHLPRGFRIARNRTHTEELSSLIHTAKASSLRDGRVFWARWARPLLITTVSGFGLLKVESETACFGLGFRQVVFLSGLAASGSFLERSTTSMQTTAGFLRLSHELKGTDPRTEQQNCVQSG